MNGNASLELPVVSFGVMSPQGRCDGTTGFTRGAPFYSEEREYLKREKPGVPVQYFCLVKLAS